MREFMAFISKETKHILRDSRTMMVLFGMPIVMMLLFGFAISTDVRNVRTVTVTPVEDMLTRRIAERLDASEYFTVTGSTDSPESAASMIRSGRADMAVVFKPSPANHRYDGEEAIQIMTDGSDPNMSVLHANYAGLIAAETFYRQTAAGQAAETRLMYNPQMKSSYNFVPGIMGMLMLIICTMMTSVSIVREKERGSMDTLLVSPVKPVVIITAKAVPYFVLSTVILACIITISRFVLGVPIAGSLPVIALVSFIYIVNGDARSHPAAVRNDISGGEYAGDTTVCLSRSSGKVVHLRRKENHDNGGRAFHHNRRDVCAARNDRNAACSCPEEFQRASEIKNIML